VERGEGNRKGIEWREKRKKGKEREGVGKGRDSEEARK